MVRAQRSRPRGGLADRRSSGSSIEVDSPQVRPLFDWVYADKKGRGRHPHAKDLIRRKLASHHLTPKQRSRLLRALKELQPPRKPKPSPRVQHPAASRWKQRQEREQREKKWPARATRDSGLAESESSSLALPLSRRYAVGAHPETPR